MRILLLHGPNLNLLGTREPEIYGSRTLAELEGEASAYAAARGAILECAQSNSEGALIDILHDARNRFDAVVFNPGAYAHYSYALRDAVAAIRVPVVEVHLSNIMEREEFRRVSVLAPVCRAQIYGKGMQGYLEALDLLIDDPEENRCEGKRG